jgi:choline monooxygenase
MKSNQSVHHIIEAIRANAALPDELAEGTPPAAYISEELLELELDLIFSKEWLCVGREDEFAHPGDYRTMVIGRDPVIILRNKDGRLRAMSNVCRHRMALLLEGAGRLKAGISCPYHAWTYNLEGQLVGASHMRDNFHKNTVCLPQFALEVWNGWVYVNLDADAPPLNPRLETLTTRYQNYRMGEYQTLFRAEEIWDTNWKILAQNFMEGYHLFVAHSKTIEPAMPTELANALHGGDAYSLYEQGRIPGKSYERTTHTQIKNMKLTEEEKNKALLFSVFPSHVVSVVAERTFWLSLQPHGTGQVKVLWGVDIFPGSVPDGIGKDAYASELKAGFDTINDEDKPIVSNIFQNAKASAAIPGRLSPKERTIWYFQRYLAKKLTTAR